MAERLSRPHAGGHANGTANGLDFSLVPLRAPPPVILRRSCDEGCDGCCQDKEAPVQRLADAALGAPLRVGAADDPSEVAAEAAAAAVLRGEPVRVSPSQAPPVARTSTDAAGTGVPADVANYLRAPGAGAPLPAPLRARLGASFGHPLDQVRLHTDSPAGEAARRLGAKAFAHGAHIVFAPGRFAPETSAGLHLLAHEVTHVLQQPGHVARQVAGSSAPACAKPVQVGAGVAKPQDQSVGPSGAYYIYGPVFSAAQADPRAYTDVTLRAWVRWRFGTLSQPVADRIVGEAMRDGGWHWINGGPPREGCQGGTRVSIAQINQWAGLAARDPKAREAAERETKAGMPELPPPSAVDQVDEVRVTGSPRPGALTSPQAGTTPGQPKDPQTAAERALDPTSIYEKGQAGANAPPFPARIDGPELEVTKGIGTYTMALDYAAVAGDEPLLQMAYAMNVVDYHWEVYDITGVLKAGLAGGVEQGMRKQEPVAPAAAAAGGATRQRAAQAVDQLSEETMRSLQERRDPAKAAAGLGAVDAVTRAWANDLNIRLLGASAILAAGGQALHALADVTGGFAKEREIAFPDRPGYYLLRCIAQPHPRGREHGEIRAASVQTKVVEMRPPDYAARNAVLMADAQLDLLAVRRRLTSDPEELKRIDAEEARLREQSSGDAAGYLRNLVAEKRAEVAAAPPWRRGPLTREQEALERRLAAAEAGLAGISGKPYRLRAAFASVVTGATYPMLLELSLLQAEKGAAVRLVDLTVADPEPKDFTGETLEKAVRNAFDNLAFHGNLGRGRLAVRMPPEWQGEPRELMLTTGNAGTELVRQRLADLATALMLLGLFVPGLGEVSAVLGAALAVERLAQRIMHGTLRFDVEAISDTLAIVGAIAQGAQLIGRLRVVQANGKFLAAMRGGEDAALKTAAEAVAAAAQAGKVADGINLLVGAGGLIWGDYVKLKGLVELQEKELAGEVTHAEASRERASVLMHAITDHGILFAGALHPGKAKGGEEPGRSGETIPEEQLARRAGEPAGPPGAGRKPDAVRRRFRTPDGQHEIFVLADGRIFRCSASCMQMRGWYEGLLASQLDPGRQQQAQGLLRELTLLEGRTTGGETGPGIDGEIGRLDLRIRDFIAPDVAAGLERQMAARGLAKPGESVLSLEQTRNLLHLLNLDDIQAIAGAGGVTSAAGLKRLASGSPRMLAAFKAVLDAWPGDAAVLDALAKTLEANAATDARLTAGYQRAAWLRQTQPKLAGGEAIRLSVEVARGVAGAEAELGAAVARGSGEAAARPAVGTRENPQARGDNCGFAAIAYALNTGGKGQAVDAEALFAAAKLRENLPNAKPTLIVEGPSGNMDYEGQAKLMAEVTGGGTGDWSFEGNAGKAGLKLERLLANEITRTFGWYHEQQRPQQQGPSSEMLQTIYARNLAQFRHDHAAVRERLPAELHGVEPKLDQTIRPDDAPQRKLQAQLREAVAEASGPKGESATKRSAIADLPGDYMVMWGGGHIDHYLNLHIGEDMKVTGYDPQNGQVYDNWEQVAARPIRYLWRVRR
jgi:hypothetical protein